jgi:hypothetical protein
MKDIQNFDTHGRFVNLAPAAEGIGKAEHAADGWTALMMRSRPLEPMLPTLTWVCPHRNKRSPACRCRSRLPARTMLMCGLRLPNGDGTI